MSRKKREILPRAGRPSNQREVLLPHERATADEFLLQPEQRFLTAVHESGHAVAAVALDVLFDYVTVVPDKNNLGHIAFRAPSWAIDKETRTLGRNQFSDRSVQQHYERNFKMAQLAGDLAEEKQRTGSLPEIQPFTSEAIVKTLVERRWPQIQRVAEALIQHQRLTSEQVKAIVEAVPQ